MKENLYDNMVRFLREHPSPLKTRCIADAFGLSVYSARYYLLELQSLGLVSSEGGGRGYSIRWRLVQ
jgi:DNA-binding IclR family transcriptional regulator